MKQITYGEKDRLLRLYQKDPVIYNLANVFCAGLHKGQWVEEDIRDSFLIAMIKYEEWRKEDKK
jgi:hypothetical protein